MAGGVPAPAASATTVSRLHSMTTVIQSARRLWVRPQVTELPPLVELTLQTGGAINGNGGSGGIGFSFVKLLTGSTESV